MHFQSPDHYSWAQERAQPSLTLVPFLSAAVLIFASVLGNVSRLTQACTTSLIIGRLLIYIVCLTLRGCSI